MLSGITLANAGLGVVHGFASVIGGYHSMPHGVICGTLLAESTKMNIEVLRRESPDSIALEKYRKVGLLMNKNNNGEGKDPLDLLVDTLFEWTKRLRVPKLGNYDIRERDLPRIIEETALKQNPVELKKSDLEKIIRNRY
jgi:alcohol dehydrogenase class IV